MFKVKKQHLPYILLAGFGLIMFFMGIMNHYMFRTVTYDYGNYNFAFWDYSHFQISKIPTFRGNFLQDHFSLTLMYFIPVYWLLNWLTGTYTLILIQNALVIISAWYTFKLIKLKTENRWLISGVIVYYFLLLGRHTSFSADVNLAIISACFIPVFIYYFEIRKYTVAMVILVLSLLSRENIPLWFISIFMVLIIQHRKEKKAIWYSFAGILISVIYFILLFKVIIPAIESPDHDYALFNYSALGETPGEALSYILKHPFESIKLFFVNHSGNPAYKYVKAEFYLVYLISGGFILLFRPKYIIWFIPIIAQKVLNDDYIRWGIATYYSVEVVTLLPLSVFWALASIKPKKLQIALTIVTCAATLGILIHKMDRTNVTVPWTLNTSKVKVFDDSFYRPPFNIRKVNKLLNQIPKDARVSASNVLLPHIAQRQYIYFFPTVKDAEYIVFSVYDDNYLFSHTQNEEARIKYLNDPKWEVMKKEFPVILLKRKEENDIANVSSESFWNHSKTITCDFESFDDEKKHILLSNNAKADTLANMDEEVARNGKRSIRLTQKNPYSHSISLPDIDSIAYLQIQVWVKDTEGKAFVVVSGDNELYECTNESKDAESSGWKKLSLNLWIPQNPIPQNTRIYFWNAGSEPAWFDDLLITKNYK